MSLHPLAALCQLLVIPYSTTLHGIFFPFSITYYFNQ
jgi:hypothetical protein